MFGLETFDLTTPLMPLIVFLLGAFAGDNLFIVLGLLNSQGLPNMWEIIIFLFLGVVIADYVYFLIGRSKSFEKFKRIKIVGKFFGRVDDTIDLMTGKNITLAFFYCKFITGAKFLVDAYLGKKGVTHTRFIFMTLLAAVIWSMFAFSIGLLAGMGFLWILDVFESLTLGFLFIGIFIAIFFKFSNKAKKHIRQKYSK